MLGKTGQDQKPFKVRSFTAMTSVSLGVCLPTLSGSYTFCIVQKEKKTKHPTQPLSFCKVSVSTRTYCKSSVYRPVDSKANSSGPLNKSVPKYNASTSIFSSDTWQFNLKSNWSCLWTSANTVWGGWTIYWFRLIFCKKHMRQIRYQVSRCIYYTPQKHP